jgi:hypothetical protein
MVAFTILDTNLAFGAWRLSAESHNPMRSTESAGHDRPRSKLAILLARTAVLLLFGLVLAGVAWNGISAEELDRFWRNIVARPGGPMAFRFALQPTMAGIAALRDGVRDARLGRFPYTITLIRDSEGRGSLFWDGIVSTARILILCVVMDIAYQWIFLGSFHPAEAALVAILLAFVPYVLLRGLIGRVARHWISQPSSE